MAAEDFFGVILHEASWGGVRIHIQRTSDEDGRDIGRHTYPHKDGADLEDLGGTPRVTRCQFCFIPTPGDEDFYGRFLEFRRLVKSAKEYPFVHPLTGSYQARVSEFTYDLSPDQRDYIAASASFEESTTEVAVLDAGPGTPLLSAVDSVKVATADCLLALSDAGLESSVPSEALAIVQLWESAEKTSREITLETVDLSNRIADETDALELALDIENYPVMVAFSTLAYNVRRAAETFTERSPEVIEIQVDVPSPLRVIAARVYGADQAEFRADEIMRLNSIPNPARVEVGVLRAYSATETRLRLKSPA